jgi:hypothetical protein
MMKRSILKYWMKLVVFVILISITMVSFACSKANTTKTTTTSTTATTPQHYLALIQQNGYMTARLYGLMSFNFNGTTVSYPTELIIVSVPIVWMGQVFSGKLEETGPGEDVTDQVHGSVSADGAWLLTLTYSRQIIHNNGKAIEYRVAVKNVPVIDTKKGLTAPPVTFEKQGDVQKYIDVVEYNDGSWNGTTITPSIVYVSTDWKNSGKGLQPILKLAFEQVPSQVMGPLQTQPGMMGN